MFIVYSASVFIVITDCDVFLGENKEKSRGGSCWFWTNLGNVTTKVHSLQWHIKNKGLKQMGSAESHKISITAVADGMTKPKIYFQHSLQLVHLRCCSHSRHSQTLSNFTSVNLSYSSNNKMRKHFCIARISYLKLYIQKIPLLSWKGVYFN